MNTDQIVAFFELLLLQLKGNLRILLPNLLGAALLLVVGWLLARLLRNLTVRVLNKLSELLPRRVAQRSLLSFGIGQPASDIISRIVYWIIIFVFVTAATETSGLPALTTWLRGLVNYLPTVLAAVMIILAGLISGVLARDFVTAAAFSAHIAYSHQLGRLVQIAIITATLMISIDQLGVDIQFLTITVAMTVGSFLISVALAFGLGAKTAVANIIGCYYVQKTYQVGQALRIGEDEGRIVEITPTSVMLDTPRGRVLIPGNRFSETSSVQLEEKDG